MKIHNYQIWKYQSKKNETLRDVAQWIDDINCFQKALRAVGQIVDENQFNREVIHPEEETLVIKSLIGVYTCHSNHHSGHIQSLKERKNWEQ